ncbi:MAG: ATP-binding protein [Acidimicrobiales bacterium]
MAAEREDALVRGLLTGIAAFRWLAWAWMAIVLLVSREELEGGRPWLAVLLVAAALVITAVTGFFARTAPDRLLAPPIIVTELAIGFALGAGDDWVFAGAHPQSLGSVWPLAGVLTAGVKWGGRGGAIAGAVVGLGRLFGALVEVSNPTDDVRASDRIAELDVSASSVVQASSSLVLYALAGGVAGYAVVKLREAEREISMVQAREEVARTLHDGVLQTLAVVQRRATDPELARLARDQERELREYLFGAEPAGGELGPRLRQAAARFEDHFEARAQVILADDLPNLPPDRVEALTGAVSEAMANAGKHGGAHAVTVYAEPDNGGRVFCSVKDDGTGFDPEVAEGIGLTRSIRARVTEVGGRVEVDGNPGRGTEVRLWV